MPTLAGAFRRGVAGVIPVSSRLKLMTRGANMGALSGPSTCMIRVVDLALLFVATFEKLIRNTSVFVGGALHTRVVRRAAMMVLMQGPMTAVEVVLLAQKFPLMTIRCLL